MTWMMLWLGLLVPRCEYVAVTYDGNAYVIGSGSDCRSATTGWVLPDNWRTIQVDRSTVWWWEA